MVGLLGRVKCVCVLAAALPGCVCAARSVSDIVRARAQWVACPHCRQGRT